MSPDVSARSIERPISSRSSHNLDHPGSQLVIETTSGLEAGKFSFFRGRTGALQRTSPWDVFETLVWERKEEGGWEEEEGRERKTWKRKRDDRG